MAIGELLAAQGEAGGAAPDLDRLSVVRQPMSAARVQFRRPIIVRPPRLKRRVGRKPLQVFTLLLRRVVGVAVRLKPFSPLFDRVELGERLRASFGVAGDCLLQQPGQRLGPVEPFVATAVAQLAIREVLQEANHQLDGLGPRPAGGDDLDAEPLQTRLAFSSGNILPTWPLSAWTMKLDTTRPSLGCMRGP